MPRGEMAYVIILSVLFVITFIAWRRNRSRLGQGEDGEPADGGEEDGPPG